MRRFLIFCAVAVVVAALTVGWNPIWRAVGVKQIKPETLAMWLGAEPPEGVLLPLLVDVRTRLEYDWFHIPGAIHAPGVIWGDTAAVEDALAGRSVILVCMTGHRSQIAALAMIRAGAADVRNLEWGMAGWLLDDGPVISSEEEPEATNATGDAMLSQGSKG